MPRKAPTQVIEQRFTLGDYERSFLAPFAETVTSSQKAESIQKWIKSGAFSVAAVGGVIVVFMGVRLISNTWATLGGILEPIPLWTGKAEHQFVENGVTKNRHNGAAGIPILGGWVSMWYDVGHGLRGILNPEGKNWF